MGHRSQARRPGRRMRHHPGPRRRPPACPRPAHRRNAPVLPSLGGQQRRPRGQNQAGLPPSGRAWNPGRHHLAGRPSSRRQPGRPCRRRPQLRAGRKISVTWRRRHAWRRLPMRRLAGSPPMRRLPPAPSPCHQARVAGMPARATARSGRKSSAASALRSLQRLPPQSPLPSLAGGPPRRARPTADRTGKRHGHPLLRTYGGEMDPTARVSLLGRCRAPGSCQAAPRPGSADLPPSTLGGVGRYVVPPQVPAGRRPAPRRARAGP